MKWNISRNFFLTEFHFLHFQKWPKIYFWNRKKCKTARNAISRKKKLIYSISRVFCLNFLKIFCCALWASQTSLYIFVTNFSGSATESANSTSIIDVAVADEDEAEFNQSKNKVISLRKEYKMVRLIKEPNKTNELGIIIAKKKLPELQPPVMGFQVVHIEPRGLIDR